MRKNRLLTAVLCIFVVLLTITFSIALPIYIRPFYYAHIDAYNLEELSGKSEEQIKEAYDEVLDYLTLPNKEFGTGEFAYSDAGKGHFEDCKFLFDLNAVVLLISVFGIIALLFLKKRKLFSPLRPFGCHFSLTCGVGTLGLFAIVGGLAALDFDKAFEVFHKIFFYGKGNWVFDSREDAIITVLPQEFFLNCGILIIASIIIISLILIIFGIFSKVKNK